MEERILNIAVIFNKRKESGFKCASETIEALIKLKINVFADKRYISELNKFSVNFVDYSNLFALSDIIIAVGGDGTIMRIAKEAAEYGKSVFGINIGRLGFLSTIERNQLNKLSCLVDKNYKINKRMMFEVTKKDKKSYAINDISINREINSPIADFILRDSGNELCRYRADGMVVSTPTGSTGYSLSAGGSIVDTDLECSIITPVCAHCLSPRSMVLSANKKISVEYILKHGARVGISIDGVIWEISEETDSIDIKKSEVYAQFICLNDSNFYQKINSKLINRVIE